MRAKPRRLRRKCGGQAIIESVMGIMLLLLIFFALLQVAILYMAQMVSDHASFVTARSYIVGFDNDIVQRAREVGTIPMSGHIEQPVAFSNLSPAQLGAMEPQLIEEFLQTRGYTLWYQHWPHISADLPMLGGEGEANIRIHVNEYPLEMPMHRAYIRNDTIDFGSRMRLHNHAGFYLD